MNEIEIYKNKDNQTEVEVRFDSESVWLNQKQMAELFDKDSDTVGFHLKNIFAEDELDELSTTELFSVVQIEGKRQVSRKIKFYNLDNNNGLVALALLVAQSDATEKVLMIKLIINLITS